MRRILALLTLLAVLIAPAAAQSDRATPSALTDLIPADAVFYLTGRADAGYLETLKGLWPRLQEEVFNGSSRFPSYEEVFEDGTLREILNDTVTWRGDHIAIAALDAKTLVAMADDFEAGFEAGGLVLAFEVKDRAAAETWLAEELDLSIISTPSTRYAVYSIPAQGITPVVMLSDDHMLITAASTFSAQLLTGDFASLSRAEHFTSPTNDLPFGAAGYDVLGYLDAGAMVREVNAQEFITREMTPYRQFRFALADFSGQMAFGGVYQNGQDFILDGAWRFGNPDALVDYGFSPTQWVTEPIDPLLMAYLPPDTQFSLQSTDLQGTYQVILDGLSALNNIAASSPELAQAFGVYGAEQNIAGLLRGSITMAFAGLTGLNLENDVLSLLDDTDYAFGASYTEDNGIDFTFDAALIARHTGGAEVWLPALSEAAALYGYPEIVPQMLDGDAGQIVDFGPILDPFLEAQMGSAVANNPSFDPVVGVNSVIAAAGTRNAVKHALTFPTDLSIVRIALPRAVSLYLPNAQAVMFINGEALQTAMSNSPQFEAITLSAVGGQDHMLGRLTLSLTTGGR